MQDLQIQYRSPSELIPYASNAKQHEDQQIAKIAASIKEFGFNNPILLDGDNGIIAGHGRLEAANKLNLEQVPTIELAHLSEAQKKGYVLADNRLGEIHTDWDFGMLSTELEALQELDFDIELTGFDDTFLYPSGGGPSDLDTDPPDDSYVETHSIIVLCADSDEQENLYNKLTQMGLTLKVVSN